MPSIYQLAPPLLAMNALRIDSPLSNRITEYERDAKFFNGAPHRRLNIRDAMPEEFDLEMPIGEWLQVPTLWVAVTLVSKGVHSVAPVYRGKQFWSAIKDDESVGLILADMARREGMDIAEFMAFERRVARRNQSSLSGGNGVH